MKVDERNKMKQKEVGLGELFTIKSDRPVVIISIEEYEGMKETIELLTQNPNLIQELKEEREQIEKGGYTSYKDFKKKYGVSDASIASFKKG